MKREYIDMVYVPKRKFNACQYVCAVTARVLYILSALSLIFGLLRPLFIPNLTVWTVWYSMVLEASAYCIFLAGRWIERRALKDEK